jgi:hypothetical protein
MNMVELHLIEVSWLREGASSRRNNPGIRPKRRTPATETTNNFAIEL